MQNNRGDVLRFGTYKEYYERVIEKRNGHKNEIVVLRKARAHFENAMEEFLRWGARHNFLRYHEMANGTDETFFFVEYIF